MLTLAVLAFCACVTLNLACSCTQGGGLRRFCKYPVVVRGVATAKWKERTRPLDRNDPDARFNMDDDWVYTVRVNQAIIMPSDYQQNKTIEVRTPIQASLCGVQFSLQVSYVFFGWVRSDGRVDTGLCDPNIAWNSLSVLKRRLFVDHLADICTVRAKKTQDLLPPSDG